MLAAVRLVIVLAGGEGGPLTGRHPVEAGRLRQEAAEAVQLTCPVNLCHTGLNQLGP